MSKKDRDLEWKNRVLCSDEGCIGVLGPDGHCKECGLAYQGELPPAFTSVSFEASHAHPSTDQEIDDTPEELEVAPDQEAATDNAEEEWAQRTLCSDESCIGVIGPDGCCKECGKPKST